MTSYRPQVVSFAVTRHSFLTHFTFKLAFFLFCSVTISYCVFFCRKGWCWWDGGWGEGGVCVWGGIWGIWVTQPSVKFICLWRWNNSPHDSRLSVIKEGKKISHQGRSLITLYPWRYHPDTTATQPPPHPHPPCTPQAAVTLGVACYEI